MASIRRNVAVVGARKRMGYWISLPASSLAGMNFLGSDLSTSWTKPCSRQIEDEQVVIGLGLVAVCVVGLILLITGYVLFWNNIDDYVHFLI